MPKPVEVLVRARRVGNGLSISLHKHVREALGIERGDFVAVRVSERDGIFRRVSFDRAFKLMKDKQDNARAV